MGSNKDTVIRFAVGNPNSKMSSVWRMWFNKPSDISTSDVYLSYRVLGGVLKISIHESGNIQYSLTGEYAKKLDIPNKHRHMDKWDLKLTVPIFKIIVPFSELKITQTQNVKGIKFIDAPLDGNAVEMFIYITQKPISLKIPIEFNLLTENELNNGNIISLIWRNNPITKENRELYISHKIFLKKEIHNNLIVGNDLRGFLYLQDGDYTRGFIDIAL